MKMYLLTRTCVTFLLLSMGVTMVFAQGNPAGNREKLGVISEHHGPVIGHKHPDVKASNNKSGFETGQLIKHNGVYHMFVNEMFGRPHLDLRCAHWTSTDAVNWVRQSTVVERIPGRSHTNLRSEVWLTGVEYNQEEEAWNIFYVAYRGGDPDKGEIFGSDYKGRIFRARSVVGGPDGIAGPYLDVDIIMQPDENTQAWEGDQGVDSFNPYEVGNKWYAFYGGHYHIPRGPWPVGLAHADKLSGPWIRMPESTNPVPIVEEFTENPVVSRLNDGRYLAIFDSYGDQEIAYSISEDGVSWVPETRLKAQSGNNTWAEDGDHYTRTPLCAIQEDDGTFTVIYTAMMLVQGERFYAIGKCTLGWE
jgi:hypothetical protein